MKRKILNGFCTGLLLFLLTIPNYAQWAVVEVNSTKQLIQQTSQLAQQMKLVATQDLSLAKQIAEYARLSQNWLQTVQHYTDSIFQMARQFTSLNGILGVAEKQLGIDQDKLRGAAEMIDGLMAIWQVKNQFQNLLETRIAMVHAWESRAKNGIFSPQADWNDLKVYLKTGLGRNSANEDALLGKMSKIDPEFGRWQDEVGRLRKNETSLNLEIKNLQDQLDRERKLAQRPREIASDNLGNVSVDQNNRVTSATDRIYHLSRELTEKEGQLQQVQFRIQELLDKMNKRYSELFWQMYEQWEQGTNVQKTGQAWEKFGDIKIEKLGEIIDSTGQELPDTTYNTTDILQ